MKRITFCNIEKSEENKIKNFKVELLIKVNNNGDFLELISNENTVTIFDYQSTFLGAIEPFMLDNFNLKTIAENPEDFNLKFEHKINNNNKFTVVINDEFVEKNTLGLPIQIPELKNNEKLISVILSSNTENISEIGFKINHVLDISNNNLSGDNEIPYELSKNTHSRLLTTYSKLISSYILFVSDVQDTLKA